LSVIKALWNVRCPFQCLVENLHAVKHNLHTNHLQMPRKILRSLPVKN